MSAHEDLIQRFAEAGAAAVDEMTSLSTAELDRAGPDEGWSPRSITHHLSDAEVVNAGRLRRLLTEDSPHLGAFDPMLLAANLAYDRPVDPSIKLFEAIHSANLTLIESLGPDAWQRTGTHEELGHYSLEVWLERRIMHDEGHIEQIRVARAST